MKQFTAVLSRGCRSHGAIWREIDDVPTDLGPTVVAIGQFDGVHRGHQRLILDAQVRGATLGLPVGAVTFDRHPATLLAGATPPLILTTAERKFDLLAGTGLDFVLALPMSAALLNTSALDFAVGVLAERLCAVSASVGSNFRYGHRAAGDVSTLGAVGRTLGFEVGGVDLLHIGGAPVSSTRIRGLIAQGQLRAATALLGRFHSIETEVSDVSRTRIALRHCQRAATPPPGRYCVHLRQFDDPLRCFVPPTHVVVGADAFQLDRDDHIGGVHGRLSIGTKLRVEFIDECT